MPRSLDFWFDFSSPYAYFASEQVIALADQNQLEINWKPILLWAVLPELDMPAPMDKPAKTAYLRADMYRSAEYFGVPFGLADDFPVSSHMPARLFYGLDSNDPRRINFLCEIFATCFARQALINDPAVVLKAAAACDIPEEEATQLMTAQASKDALKAAIKEAVEAGIWGVPYMQIDDQRFFGADRLPQLEWYLNKSSRRSNCVPKVGY